MSRKRHPIWRTLLVMGTDLVAIGAGLWCAYWLRFWVGVLPVVHGYRPEHYLEMLPWAWGIWFFALRFENLYRRRSRVLDFNVVRRILTGSILALLALIAVNFYLRVGEFSRPLTLMLLGLVGGALVLNRVVLHFIFQWMMLHHGIGQSRTVVLGTGPLARQLCQSVARHPEFGMRLIGLISPRSIDAAAFGATGGDDPPLLGDAGRLEALLAEHRVDEVILAQPELERERIPELLVQCERAMTEFRIVPETTELLFSGMVVETLDGIPLLGIRETPLQGWMAALKRMVDVATALVGLMLMAPVLAVLAWWIRRCDGHDAFFTQERMGIDGRLFRIIKLRTMRPDAECGSGPVFASDFDPRCTPLGAFLRRTHLDELPQLINVLRGDMSLVGPRPERPYFIEQFRDHVPRYMARHKVRSGMTGWAQVNGLCGPHGSIPERLKYDLYYIEHWSLWLDLKILVMTLIGRIRPGPVA